MEAPRMHPLYSTFSEGVTQALRDLNLADERIEDYLTRLLIEFIHRDRIFAIRDASGRRLSSIAEMLEEGDVRYRATSFEREREVHKHLGDFLLFWSGMFPEELRGPMMVDAKRQGVESYAIAASFDHPPHHDEAPLLGKLATDFEAYQRGLRKVRTETLGLKDH